MTISDIELEMELNGVEAADIAAILSVCKTRGYASEILDEELEKRGYERIFSFDFEEDEPDWDEEDDFGSTEPFPHKHRFDDE